MIKENRVVGRKPVLELLESGVSIESIFINRKMDGEFSSTISTFCRERAIPLKKVPVEKLNRMFSGNHQGIIVFRSPIDYYLLSDVLPTIYEKGETPLFVLLDGVTDIGNVGAIARTAWATGAHALIIPLTNTAGIGPDAIKASAGALNKLPVCREKSIKSILEELKLNGVQLIGLAGKGKKGPKDIDFKLPTCIVLGSEGEGIPKEDLAEMDEIIRLPMARDFESYNVSVSAAMALYEVMDSRS